MNTKEKTWWHTLSQILIVLGVVYGLSLMYATYVGYKLNKELSALEAFNADMCEGKWECQKDDIKKSIYDIRTQLEILPEDIPDRMFKVECIRGIAGNCIVELNAVMTRPEVAALDREHCKTQLLGVMADNPKLNEEINMSALEQDDKPILNRGSKWVFTCDRTDAKLYLIHPDQTILPICSVRDKGICTNTETVFNQPPKCYATLQQADGDFSKVCNILTQLHIDISN